ncbi:hypothetical protein [Vibrio sinaloensis]|uniref:hypothetical protein n=1 Tax=Photobacterium sp. (strain ATCC 43367) TaxID=379097 RepID=UPI0022AFBE23|nr:hypothetical protein [Vibrio sinaloensis]MCZ4296095.1 hypothetical protein [Vibrio sinaloensis]
MKAQLAGHLAKWKHLKKSLKKVVDTKLYLAKMTASSEVMLVTKKRSSLKI